MSSERTPGRIRPATPDDVPEILAMVRELAEYERSGHEVEATAEQLTALLFGGTQAAPGTASTTPNGAPAAYAHVVDHPDAEAGTALGAFALWFLNTSTWTGTHGVYLEDLYVRPGLRGTGYGKRLLQTLAQVCQDNGYRRLEWWVLDWNEPALGFYRSIGAVPMDEWTVHRVAGDALVALASGGDTGDTSTSTSPGA
jgi:GNAT superfamily N-acetyltransferase